MLTSPPLCACAAAGKHRYYLALNNSSQGNYSSNVAFYFVYLVTYWLLFSYLVPISLFVTIEIVKFVLVRPFRARLAVHYACSCLCMFLLSHHCFIQGLQQRWVWCSIYIDVRKRV